MIRPLTIATATGFVLAMPGQILASQMIGVQQTRSGLAHQQSAGARRDALRHDAKEAQAPATAPDHDSSAGNGII